MLKQGIVLSCGLLCFVGAVLVKENSPAPQSLANGARSQFATASVSPSPMESPAEPDASPEAVESEASSAPEQTPEPSPESTASPEASVPPENDEEANVFPGPRPSAATLQALHQQAVVVDTKVYTPVVLTENPKLRLKSYQGQAGFQQLKDGGVDVVFFSVFVNPYRFQQQALARAEYSLRRLRQEMLQNKSWIEWATSNADIERIVKAGKIAAIVGLENPAPLGQDLKHLERLYKQGVRYISPAWSAHSEWADSAAMKQPRWNGLSPLGKEAVAKMNQMGILIDVSHLSEPALQETLKLSQQPVIASQSATAKIQAHPFNLTDASLKLLNQNGGVIGVPLDAEQLGAQDIKTVVKHLDYTARAAGLENVGLASGFESRRAPITGLTGARDLPKVTEALVDRGYSQKQVYQMMGENYLRVFRQVLK